MLYKFVLLLIQNLNCIRGIQARDFGNKELIKNEKGKTFNPDYVGITDPRVLEIIANRRSECEREFSRDKWGYRRDRMPNRGDKEAELFMLIYYYFTYSYYGFSRGKS